MKPYGIVVVLAFLIGCAMPVRAHHSALEFAAGQKLTLHGVITRVEWVNPHVYCFLEVTDPASTEVKTWELELGNPGALGRRGIRKDNLKPAAVITVIGRRASDGTFRLSPDQIIFSK